MRTEIDPATLRRSLDSQQFVAVPVHTSDTCPLESGGEATRAAPVEAEHVNATGGERLCVDAHRLTDRYRFGHGAVSVVQHSPSISALLVEVPLCRNG